eukprot:c11440_g2_i1.p1 GENE.c11440_g2_i1~~c11440_g2_i1.p1  ORF type:complete len:391 (+),score=61.13 c11440_g2_i1:835-2007(+)
MNRERPLVFSKKWQTDLVRCIDSTPTIERIAGRSLVFIGSHAYLICATDIETGHEIWRVPVGGRVGESACVVSPSGQFVAVGSYDSAVYVYETVSGDLHHRVQMQSAVKATPRIHPQNPDWLVCVDHSGTVVCVDLPSKSVVWELRCPEPVFASPALVTLERDCCMIIATLTGHIYRHALPSGAPLDSTIQNWNPTWHFQTSKPIFSNPLIVDDVVAVGCVDCSVYCIALADGMLKWRSVLGGPIFGSAVLGPILQEQRQLLVGSDDHFVYRLRLSDGHSAIVMKANERVVASPVALINQTIATSPQGEACSCRRYLGETAACVVDVSGAIFIVNVATSEVLASANMRGATFASPKYDCQTGRIVIGTRNNKLKCLQLGCGDCLGNSTDK